MSSSKKLQYLVGAVFAIVVLGGFLIADGAFSNSWTVTSTLAGATSQMSDFGPPTRLMPPEESGGVVTRSIVAEPVYIEVRVPSFFDEIAVEVTGAMSEEIAAQAHIGFELGRDSALFRLQDVTRTRDGDAWTLRAHLPLSGIPHEDNRFRIVLSVPGVSHENPVVLNDFQVTARRSGSASSLISRLIPSLP